MRTISTAELEKDLSSGPHPVLINALSEQQFQSTRIPGSVNIPVESEKFLDHAQREAGNKEAFIVTYCASAECDASTKAAKRLEDAGFSNVFEYEGGAKEWTETGHALEHSN